MVDCDSCGSLTFCPAREIFLCIPFAREWFVFFAANPRLFDLALVELKEALPSDPGLAKRIRPVVMPSRQLIQGNWPPNGTACLIIGWGCTQEGEEKFVAKKTVPNKSPKCFKTSSCSDTRFGD